MLKLGKLFDKNAKKLKRYAKLVEQINALGPDMKKLSDEDFPKKTQEFKERLEKGETLDDLLPEAFAIVREAADRVIGERHYDVQLIGGIALHNGNIAEMQTGEGKTLSSTCPSYLNALTSDGVHIVTPNDYLAKRDSQWMGQIYNFLGLTIGLIQHGHNSAERQEAYGCDITYGTNNEFGFDYLRDNMQFDLKHYVQRDFNFAVVDEVDSILIDESRTPLIISGPTDDNIEKYYVINQAIVGLHLSREIRKEEVAKLPPEENHGIDEDWNEREDHDVVREGDYSLDERGRNIALTERGSLKAEQRLKNMLAEGTSLFDYENIEVLHHVNQALKAHYIFKLDVDYVVHEGQVVIVDEFTGRLMPGRRFSDGLHQALEAKEGVRIERENQTLASITFQNYFRLYKKLSGMTGTAETEREEFEKIYNLGVVSIPTNRPVVRKDQADIIYKTVDAKFQAITNLVKELHENRQPVLVGTVSVEVSETISRMFHKAQIPHEVLNAKNHEREAEIVSLAGTAGAVTIATNMAGRGTDIKPDEEALKAGGLFVLGTERHDSRRIDNQLRGRSGRQGDAGASQFFLSLEDDLLRIFGGEKISKIMDRLNIEEDEPIEHAFITRAIENAQKKVEGHHFSIRKHLLEYDDVMNRQRTVIYERRRSILNEATQDLLLDMMEEVSENLMDEYCGDKYVDQWDIQGFNHHYLNIFNSLPNENWQEEPLSADQFLDMFFEHTQKEYKARLEYFKSVFVQIEGEYREEDFQRMVTDLEKQILLSVNDNLWKDHLLSMDHLREEIGLVGYAQKKPIVEYKKRGFELFSDLMRRISHEVVTLFCKTQLATTAVQQKEQPPEQEMTLSHGEVEPEEPKQKKSKPKGMPAKKQVQVGRNDPCPCGSGKKYKKCHGRTQNTAVAS